MSIALKKSKKESHILFKTLILNFAYIHSKRRKLGMFILFQKCQFVSKQSNFATNSPISFIFNFWSLDHNLTFRHTNTSRFTLGKVQFVPGLLAGNIANYAYAQSTSLTQASRWPEPIFWLCFWIAFFGRNDLTDFYDFWHP